MFRFNFRFFASPPAGGYAQNDNNLEVMGEKVTCRSAAGYLLALLVVVNHCHSERSEESIDFYKIILI